MPKRLQGVASYPYGSSVSTAYPYSAWWAQLTLPWGRWRMRRATAQKPVNRTLTDRLWQQYGPAVLTEQAGTVVLYEAVRASDTPLLTALLRAGVRPAPFCTWPTLALRERLMRLVENPDTLKRLMDHGALPDGEDVTFWAICEDFPMLQTALDHRRAPKASGVGAVMRESYPHASPGEVRALRLLLEHGADPNEPDKEGIPALHWAAACASEEATSLLLAAGAQPEARAADGRCAAEFAEQQPVSHRSLYPVSPGGAVDALLSDRRLARLTAALPSATSSAPTAASISARRRRL